MLGGWSTEKPIRNFRESRLGWLHNAYRTVNQKGNFYFRRKR